jgi:hypothetical protein
MSRIPEFLPESESHLKLTLTVTAALTLTLTVDLKLDIICRPLSCVAELHQHS